MGASPFGQRASGKFDVQRGLVKFLRGNDDVAEQKGGSVFEQCDPVEGVLEGMDACRSSLAHADGVVCYCGSAAFIEEGAYCR